MRELYLYLFPVLLLGFVFISCSDREQPNNNNAEPIVEAFKKGEQYDTRDSSSLLLVAFVDPTSCQNCQSDIEVLAKADTTKDVHLLAMISGKTDVVSLFKKMLAITGPTKYRIPIFHDDEVYAEYASLNIQKPHIYLYDKEQNFNKVGEIKPGTMPLTYDALSAKIDSLK